MAIRSKICYNMVMSMHLVYTIGYSGYGNTPEAMIVELTKRKINVLIDVRSNPYSAQFNGYNKESFAALLSQYGIKYRNYANFFGAKQEDSAFYSKFDGTDSRIDYELFTKSEQFKQGVKNMETIVEKGLISVIMCSEKDPINCHRAIMVAKTLSQEYGFEIKHIVPEKEDETQEELEKRMMNTISCELRKKKKLNVLEKKMKEKIAESESLFADELDNYTKDVNNYYRIINSRIGWTREEVLGYKK